MPGNAPLEHVPVPMLRGAAEREDSMNKAITDGLLLMPSPFADGLQP